MRAAASHRRGDYRLAEQEEPPLGAHLVAPRFGYAHHGIYVGGGAVVHYRSCAGPWHRGPVEEIALTRFSHGRPLWIRPQRAHELPCTEILRRAHSRLGERCYRLFSNNCEHLSEWCVNGVHRSLQVERFLKPVHSALQLLKDLTRLLTLGPLRADEARFARP